jgi:hypothetical protein
MDGTRFDNLIKRLAATPVTRATALRGLAAGAATLAGVTLLAEPGAAADGDGKRRRRRRVCDCQSADPNSCTNRRLKRRAARRLLRSNDCAYKGRCTGVSGCAAFGCDPRNPTGSCQAGQICSPQAICVAGCIGTNGSQANCPVGQICVIGAGQTTGQCRTGPVCTPVCNPNQVCCPPGTLKAGKCQGDENACRTP